MKIGFALVSTFFLLSHASQINALTPVVTRSDPTTISFTLTPSIDDEVWAGWVGLPPGATIRRSFVSIDGPVRPAPRIAPAGWKGAPTIEVGDIGLLRFHRVCHVKVTTSALTPRGTIGVPKQIVVTLTLVGAKPSVLRKNPGFDTMLSSLLINWNSAQHWIEEFEVPDPPTPAPAPSVRILLRDEGLFRLTYDDLEDNLLQLIDDPGVIDPRRVALWNMGQLAPIAVHSSGPDSLWQPGDWIEFYAHGNWRQDPQGRWTSVEGKYTMDNPYFFVWDQDDPPRMADTPAEPQGGQTARFHWWVSHQEINDRPSISGHEGTIDDEWYWGDPFYPGELTKSFVINDIMQEGPAGEIRARFLAITDVDTVEYDHSVNLMLNGNLVAGDTWGGFGARLIEGSGVKAESGQNVLTIQSVGNPISGLRLDWFAVRYPRDYVVSGTQTSFAPSAEDNNEYAISGVAPGAKVEVFEVSTGLRLIGFQDVADHDGIVRFNYAIHDTGRIWVVQEEGWLSIDSTSLTHVRLDDPIADPSREGQYLVIYPADWLEQALGFKTLHLDRGDVQTADIVHLDDIWEEFSYGLRDPRALRWFLQWALANWAEPPEFVLLLGDGTWDYNEYKGPWPSAYLVPSYGNPASDNFYASLNDTSFYPDIYLGRIPATSGAQAAMALTKAHNYLSNPSYDLWRKKVLFVNGGGTEADFALYSSWNSAIHHILIKPPPSLGAIAAISKDVEDYMKDIYNESIRAAIDSGCVIISFFGHGATETWDYMLESKDADLLNNGTRMPFMLSPTCFAGDFATPRVDSIFAERFLRLDDPQHGAIGFFGSSGTSYLWEGFEYAWAIFTSLFSNSDPRMGPAVNLAKLWSYPSPASTDSIMASVYNLLGDPLLTLVFPKEPDLHVDSGSITFDPPEPAAGDSVTLSVVVLNEGIVWESEIRVVFMKDDLELGYSVTTPNSLESHVSFVWAAPNQAGEQHLRLVVDPESTVPDPDQTDNSVSFDIMLLNPRPIPHMPISDAMITGGTVDMVIEPTWEGLYEFQVATTDSFGSTLVDSATGLAAEEGFIRWTWQTTEAGVCCWRARVEGGAWSIPRWFTIGAAGSGWSQNRPGQLEALELENCEVSEAGVSLREIVGATDYAHLDEGATVPWVSSCNYAASGPENLIGGIVHNTDWGGSFYFSQQIQDPTVDQWAIVDLGQERLIKRVASAHEGRALSKRSVWSYFGIETSDSLDLGEPVGWRDWGHTLDYADSGYGPWIPSNIAYEMADPIPVRYIRFSYGRCYPFPTVFEGSRVYEVYANQAIYPDSGIVFSPVLGPAAEWNEFASGGEIPEETGAVIRIELGKNDGSWVDGGEFGLGSVNSLEWIAADYPKIRLRAYLTSPNRDITPRLSSWQVAYSAIPDLGVAQDTVLVAPVVPEPGSLAQLSAVILNIGSEPASSAAYELTAIPETGDPELLESESLGWLAPGASVEIATNWEAVAGVTQFTLSLDPDNLIQEADENNNIGIGEARVLGNLAWDDSVTLSPAYPAPGETLTIEAITLNDGVLGLGETEATCVWIDVAGENVTATVAGLAPTEKDSLRWIMEVVPSIGETELLLFLDPDTLLAEVTREDNELRVPVTIVQPADPSISYVEVYCSTPPPGDPVEITLRIVNLGGRDTGDFALSCLNDSGWTEEVLIPNLSQAESTLVTISWPTGDSEGEYIFLFEVDPDSLILDHDRLNNTALLDIQTVLAPDIGLELFSFTQSPPTAGEETELRTEIRNRSLVSATGFDVRLEENGELVDEQRVSELAGTTTIPLSWNLTFHDPGDRTLTLIMDHDDEIVEACEEDNSSQIDFTVVRPWDLSLSEEDLQRENPSLSFTAWDSLALVISVRNIGEQVSPPAPISLFDGLPGSGGTLISSQMTDSVLPGAADTLRAWWPAGTSAGSHLLVGLIDPDGTLDEWNTDNNTGMRTIDVLGDTLPPEVEIRPPWAGFQEGGFLSADDTLFIVAWDEDSGIALIELLLDGEELDANGPEPDSSSGLPGVAIRLPAPGPPGDHVLTAKALDRVGLYGEGSLSYHVSGALLVNDVAAFPSPASGPTWITAIVSVPGNVRIAIYTPSGRLIRLLEGTVYHPGRTGLEWDLLDQDSDRIANGVYLIRFTVTTADSEETALGKLLVRK